MAKLKGKAKEEFLARMARGRAAKKRGGGSKKGSRSSGASSSGAMVPYKVQPLAVYSAPTSTAGRSRSGQASSTTRGRLTTALEIVSKKQNLIASWSAAGLLAFAEDQDLMKSIPALDPANGLGPEFTIAIIGYFAGDTSVLQRYPKLRSYLLSVSDSIGGIAFYKLVRRYLQKKRKEAGQPIPADIVPWSVSGEGGVGPAPAASPQWNFRQEL